MESDVDEDVMVSPGEDLEVYTNSQLSTKLCSCGAYDKIMSATNLLRKRILEAVNNELNQYEQPLGFLLSCSKQDFMGGYKDCDTIENVQVKYDGSGNSHQSISQSQSQTSEFTPSQSPSIDVVVNNILVNASLLLLSKLK